MDFNEIKYELEKVGKCVLCICSFLFCSEGYSQNIGHFDGVYYSPDSAWQEGDMFFRLTDINFFKNDEYFSEYVEGYTLVGYRLQPSLVYYLHKPDSSSCKGSVIVEVGAQLLHYGGTERYDVKCPSASVRWQIDNRWALIMGMLDGHSAHKLPEPMWDTERQLVDKPEMGLQVKFKEKMVDAEIWLNWQQFIKRYDTIPEKLTFGLRADISPLNGSPFYFNVPIRLLISHIGGQISDYPERMQSLMNSSVALRIGTEHKRSTSSHILFAECEFQQYHAMVDKNVRPFHNGVAFYPKVCYSGVWKNRIMLDANAGLWTARNYFSLYGNPSYMSISNYNSDVYSRKRKMVIGDMYFGCKINDVIRFSLGGKAYYDINVNHLDYSYYAGMVLTPQWRIARIPLLNSLNRK